MMHLDAASRWQILFQDPASPVMEGIIEFHHDLMFLLVFIFVAIPSFAPLYSIDERINPALTLKAEGHQSYWTYEYSDSGVEYGAVSVESYMVPEKNLTPGMCRFLETNNRVVLPANYRKYLTMGASVPLESTDVQLILLLASGIFLLVRMVMSFLTAPTFDRGRQVGTAVVLPGLLILLTSWDIFCTNPWWVSLLRVFLLFGSHYALNRIRPFMNDLSFVRLNAEISRHYEEHTRFSFKYGAWVSWNTFIGLTMAANLVAFFLKDYPLCQSMSYVLFSIPLLILALSSVADTICIIRAPYPPNTLLEKHGVPVRFLPIGQVAAKITVACGRAISTGAKSIIAGTTAFGSLHMLDLTFSKQVGKEHPFPPNQWCHKVTLRQLGVDLKNNPSWNDIGEGWNEYARSKDQK